MSKILTKTKIDILGTKWALHEIDYPDYESEDFGDCLPHIKTVRIFRSHHDRYGRSTTSTKLHESIHAILKQSGASELLSETIEETIVTAIEHGIFPLIQSGMFNEKTIKKEESETKPKSKRRPRRSRKSP